MLTIFSTPKAFHGHIGVIQRNAIASWSRLRPRPALFLLGAEAGSKETAREFGLEHIPEVACNAQGTPRLDDLFRQVEARASAGLLCYVNADIVLTSDFARAVGQVAGQLSRFLIVSQRINMEITEPLDFAEGWEQELKARAARSGTAAGHTSIDIFVFPKGTYGKVPDFGIGRPWFDQWLIKAAKQSGTPVVDLSQVAPLYHQDHHYNHVAGGAQGVMNGVEAAHNLQLYGGIPHAFTLLDVTHELNAGGNLRRVRWRREMFSFKQGLWKIFLHKTVAQRNALRLRRKFWIGEKSAPETR